MIDGSAPLNQAFRKAIKYGQLDIVQFLHPFVTTTNDDLLTAYHNGHFDVLEFLNPDFDPELEFDSPVEAGQVERQEIIENASHLLNSIKDPNVVWALLQGHHKGFYSVSKSEIKQLVPSNTELATIDLFNFISKPASNFDLSKYNKVEILGQGNYGQVSLYTNENGSVAVKEMQTKSFVDLFKEINIYSLMDLNKCQGVLKMFDFSFTSTTKTLVLQKATSDLQKLIDADQIIEKEKLIVQLLDALACFEKCGFIHGDIKPANILMINDQPKIGDFGIAKYHLTIFGDHNQVYYSAHCRPPEFFTEPPYPPPTFQSDCWAMAKTISYVCAGMAIDGPDFGRVPFDLSQVQKTIKRCQNVFKSCVTDSSIMSQLIRMIDEYPQNRCIVSQITTFKRENSNISQRDFMQYGKQFYEIGLAEDIEFPVIANALDCVFRYYQKVPFTSKQDAVGIASCALLASSTIFNPFPLSSADVLIISGGFYSDQLLLHFLKELDGIIVLPGIDHIFESGYGQFKDVNYNLYEI